MTPNERYLKTLIGKVQAGGPLSDEEVSDSEDLEVFNGQKIFFTEGGKINKVSTYLTYFVYN